MSRYPHEIAVMKDGLIVESGEARWIFFSPRHPYTKELIQMSLQSSAAGNVICMIHCLMSRAF